MKKCIFWDMKKTPLSITSLDTAKIMLARESDDTTLCIEDVRCTDLQLMIDSLSMYNGIGKEMRAIQAAIGTVNKGQQLLFDKSKEIDGKHEKVIAQGQNVLNKMLPAMSENNSLKQEVKDLQEEIYSLKKDANKGREKVAA